MVLVVDHHVAFRQALAFLLGRQANASVVVQVGSLQEASDKLEDVELAFVDLGILNEAPEELARICDLQRRVVTLEAFGKKARILAHVRDEGRIEVVPEFAGLDDLMAICRPAV